MLDRLLLSAGGEEKLYVEDVFSTYLYTGNGSTQTITNGIDLAGKGGMVWVKSRSVGTSSHCLTDTARGATSTISSDSVAAQFAYSGVTSFSSSGFVLGSAGAENQPSATFASWTFRKAPKFFDVVTYTGTGSARTIAHSLGVAPGCILVKRTDTTSNWAVYHRGNTSAAYYEKLNLSDAEVSDSTVWNSTAPTDSVFSVGTSALTNASGGTYVAYVFAHDATSDGIIQCGSFTTDGSGNATVNLGFEPQWLLLKRSDAASNWMIMDDMRGLNYSALVRLFAENASAESNISGDYVHPTATGFELVNSGFAASATYVYIAIRRGPMKTPTLGTSVFSPNTTSGTTGTAITTGFPVDLQFESGTLTTTDNHWFVDRLRGVNSTDDTSTSWKLLDTNLTNAETASTFLSYGFGNTAFKVGSIRAGTSQVFYNFRRAPGFFDEVCYTGTGVARTLNHNLGVAPELMIVKRRDNTGAWQVYSANLANTEYLVLNTTAAKATGTTRWNSTTPTSTVLTVGTDATVNASGGTYVAYLFASCPGVSKVGSYTGNGSSQTINCGFSSGARFFLVKRADSSSDWWVYDSARGIVAAADPALRLNSTAAEVTSADAVDTDSTGIIVNQEATCNINVNGGTYIYLAIA